MRYFKLLRSSAILLILLAVMACTSTPPQPSTTTREVLSATPTLTKTALPTATHTPTPTRTPTIAYTSTPTSIPTTAHTPSPAPRPIKPILLEFGTTGGDGGTSYDVFFGREMPSLVLYTDGQLLIGDFSYSGPGGYSQTKLSTQEMCALLRRLQATGFFDVKGTGQNYPADPIYKTSEYFGDGGGSYILRVNGNPAKWVDTYSQAVDNLVPEVKAAYELVSKYRPRGMKPFRSDRVIIRIEPKPGEDWFGPTPTPPQLWPSTFPSLTAFLKEHSQDGEVILSGQSATLLSQLIPLPGSGFFTENGETYFVVARPLLPHEMLTFYSQYSWSDESFDLPFKCTE